MLNGNEPTEVIPSERPDARLGASYLVADCGSSTTTVSLFDVVDGRYRFVAQGSSLSTGGPPWSDLARGVQFAINQITQITGRLLLNDKGTLLRPARPDGSGVDYFGATLSAAGPLRTVIAGLLDDVSVASARRVLETIYAIELDRFSLGDGRGQPGQIESLLDKKPNLIFLTGGTDGGADAQVMKLVDTIELGLSLLDEARRPIILYAGNQQLRQRVSQALRELAEVHMLPNVRPVFAEERLDEAIRMVAEFYAGQWAASLPGVSEIQSWSNFPLVPAAHAFAGVCEYLGAVNPLLGLDLGASSVSVVSAERQRTRLLVRSDLGLDRPLGENPSQAAIRAALAAAPVEMSENSLRDYALNRTLRPGTVPLTEDELVIEWAVMQSLVHRVMSDARARWPLEDRDGLSRYATVLLRGRAFTNAPRPGAVLLMVLDAIRLAGVYRVMVDHQDILPALGLLAPYAPELVVQTLEHDGLRTLAWVVAPAGDIEPDIPAVRLRVESSKMDSLHSEVMGGALEVIPVPPGHSVSVTLYPERGLDVGAGPGHNRKLTLSGSVMGLVVDARGGRTAAPVDPGRMRVLRQGWLKAVGAQLWSGA